MSNSWSAEIWRIIGLLVIGLVVGLIFDYVLISLFLSTLFYLAWHIYNLVRLDRWLRQGKKSDLPQAGGVWGEIYYQLHRLQQRNRKRKRKLAAQLNRFQESTAAMPDAMVVLNEIGGIEWWNEAATRLLGLRSPQDLGQRIDNLVRFPAFTQYLAADNFSERVEMPSPNDDRIMLSVQIISYGNNQRLFVARDVTPLHRLEQIRRDFIANVSHELRTPLTVMVGFLETILDADSDIAKSWGRSLHLMQQQAQRMQRIVEDLLLLSRLESNQKVTNETEVQVPPLLFAIREEALALSGDKRHRIELNIDSDLWLKGSETELRSAFSNLVFNAVQYSPADATIYLYWHAENDHVYFSVRDTGIGIAAHHIPRLTERFYRADTGRSRENGGTGLGLAIVKHVLNRHQAQLQIESEVGKGSKFTCVFPRSRQLTRAEKKAVLPN